MIVNLPEPLMRATIAAGHMLAANEVGTTGGLAHYDYRHAVGLYRACVLATLRAKVERGAPGYTLREAALWVYAGPHPRAQLWVVVCAAGRPECEVSELRRRDRLYVVRGSKRGTGLVVNAAAPKNVM